MLQLPRFDYVAGHLVRLEYDLNLEHDSAGKPIAYIPIQTHLPGQYDWSLFRIHSLILHYGESPQSGHYVALLFDEGR